ncbi:MAG: long-chain fatty acid--CoA ligase [Acidobacteriota bacterium]
MSDRSFQSVVEMFHHRISTSPDSDAMYGRRGGEWYTLTWRDVGDRARQISCGLRSLGVEKSQRCAILSMTRPEWVTVDMAILCAGGATTTIYPSNTPEECAYILGDSEAVVVFAENAEQAAKLVEVRGEVPAVKAVVVIEGAVPGGTADDGWLLTLDDLAARGAAWESANPGAYEEVADSVQSDDLATLIYTSGTTGKPKGVMLTHDNWVFEAGAIEEIGVLSPTDKHYLFLPLAHSFAKVLEVASVRIGVPTAVDGSIDDLVDNLAVARPTVMAAVPRVFEKVYNKVVSGAREAGGLKYKIFLWSLEVGKEVSRLRQAGKDASGLLAFKHKVADKLVFSKLKDRFGGRIRFFVSGGAPLAREIAEFFHAADILVLEGYGLTESSAASFVNRPEQYKFGTVGLPVPGAAVEIAEDGEILIRGRGVMKGYYNRPEDTAEALDSQGRLYTGDVGFVDEDGFLKITDRKKDIIVTAGGKNIAPQNVENQLKASCNYISQVVMLGDKRPFCIALITINEETVGKWASDQGIAFSDYADLASKAQVHDLIWDAVQAVNGDLASYETIKKIHLLPADFSQETGELTPKMSIKRKVVETRNQDVLERMYEGTGSQS